MTILLVEPDTTTGATASAKAAKRRAKAKTSKGRKAPPVPVTAPMKPVEPIHGQPERERAARPAKAAPESPGNVDLDEFRLILAFRALSDKQCNAFLCYARSLLEESERERHPAIKCVVNGVTYADFNYQEKEPNQWTNAKR